VDTNDRKQKLTKMVLGKGLPLGRELNGYTGPR
jgi:hypothetical protein